MGGNPLGGELTYKSGGTWQMWNLPRLSDFKLIFLSQISLILSHAKHTQERGTRHPPTMWGKTRGEKIKCWWEMEEKFLMAVTVRLVFRDTQSLQPKKLSKGTLG